MAPIQGYATPGIYVEEISTLPPSVAEIATAIPAFIGYTEKHAGDQPMIKEIRSLRDYEESFGQAPSAPWKIIVTETKTEANQFTYEIHGSDGNTIPIFSKPTFLLWYAIDLYFRNGGGRCFVVSVGVTDGDSAPDDVFKKDKFREGIKELEKADDPTLVIIPEATQLTEPDYRDVCGAALTHTYNMKDRFVILDTKTDIAQTPTDAAKELRDTVGTCAAA
jgi:phage tail sheath protein FI